MAEVYPSDSELVNIQSDTETGVEYIPTGTAPYYIQFRKLLYRLLLASRRANDLRVYDESGLDIGVKPGKFWFAAQLISYAGSSGNALADDKQNIYIYLDGSATVTLTLPASAVAGTIFSFAVQAAQDLRIDPGTAAIRDDSGQTADKYKSATAIGACLSLVADANGDWATIAKNGAWTEEA